MQLFKQNKTTEYEKNLYKNIGVKFKVNFFPNKEKIVGNGNTITCYSS